MASKSERRAAQDRIAEYQEARLAELVVRAGQAIDGFRDGDLDAFAVDHVLFQYGRAAKEPWKFCNSTDVVMTARLIDERPPFDWWEAGAPRRP